MTCDHPMWGTPGALECILQPGHTTGHVYRSTSGVPDRHLSDEMEDDL